MTPEQRLAHERLQARIPVRTVVKDDHPLNEDRPKWPEKDRELSPEERAYLWDW